MPTHSPIPDDQTLSAILGSLFNLSEDDTESIHYEFRTEGKIQKAVLSVQLKKSAVSCPYCQSDHIVGHGKLITSIGHNVILHRNTEIELIRRRYRCMECRKTFTEFNPMARRLHRHSYEVEIDILTDLKNINETFTSVGRRYNLSSQQVSNIFDRHVSLPRKPLPKRLLIDENFAIHLPDSDYVVILLDFDSGEIIDVLPTRRKKDLVDYFLGIPLEERENVEMVGIDMYSAYKGTAEECLPGCSVCVDHFHVVQEFGRQEDEIRKQLMRPLQTEIRRISQRLREIQDRSDGQSQTWREERNRLKAERDKARISCYLLKKFHWFLAKDWNDPMFDPGRKRKYNASIGRSVNYFELRQMLLECAPPLKQTTQFRRSLKELYSITEPEQAEEFLDQLIIDLKKKSAPKEMQHFGTTLKRWRKEILNSLEVIEVICRTDRSGNDTIQYRHINNGLIEQVNSKIKTLRKNANGMGNFRRFRNRIMYTINPSSTYHMDPVYEKIQKKSSESE